MQSTIYVHFTAQSFEDHKLGNAILVNVPHLFAERTIFKTKKKKNIENIRKTVVEEVKSMIIRELKCGEFYIPGVSGPSQVGYRISLSFAMKIKNNIYVYIENDPYCAFGTFEDIYGMSGFCFRFSFFA
jgi:hypothetical protein